MMVTCHYCEKEIDAVKEPKGENWYFHQVLGAGIDLYWCSWECIENHVLTSIPWRRKLINKLNKIESVTMDFTV